MIAVGMIETLDQLQRFCNESEKNDLLLHVVPLHDGIHPAANSPILLFVKDLPRDRTFYYSFGHPDVKTLKDLTPEQVMGMISAMKGRKWAVDKKSFDQLVPVLGTLDVGLAQHLTENNVFEISDFDTSAHTLVRRNFMGRPGYGKFVPLMKHLETFAELAETCEKVIKKARIDDAFEKFNRLLIEPLTEVEHQGLAVDLAVFREHFGDIFVKSGLAFTQYNFYTSTGRPSNRFGGVNYAALNKEDGSRKAFVSRFGQNGKLVLIDYSAFHPRIIAKLVGYDIPATTDIYEYLARLYFQKKVIDEMDVANAKQITFRQLYGGVEEKYSHIKYLSHLKDFIDEHWRQFHQNGYVETPIFKRRITDKHLQNPKPATVFNYLLQAAEGEISIPILGGVNEFLRTKQSKAVLYTYDSILFDCCLDDAGIFPVIKDLMSLGGEFPLKVYVGDNYQDMTVLR